MKPECRISNSEGSPKGEDRRAAREGLIASRERNIRTSDLGFLSAFELRTSELALLAFVTLALLTTRASFAQVLASNTTPPTVGMEGRLEIILPEAELTAVASDHHAPMVVRIASAQPHGTLTRYDLRYIGRVPGQHDLRDYLLISNGVPATNLPALGVEVAGLLPTPHNGWLEEQAHRSPSLFGGYRAVMIAVILLWIVALAVILRVTRKPKSTEVEMPASRVPSLADKLRPLVERAAAGRLSADEKALLERMLITHWQRRLRLHGMNGEDLISRLRAHPEAGALLRTLEDWLHRPPGSPQVSVEPVLEPYRNLPVEEPGEVGA